MDESLAAASAAASSLTIDERILQEILKFFEMNLDRGPLQEAIAQFFVARYEASVIRTSSFFSLSRNLFSTLSFVSIG